MTNRRYDAVIFDLDGTLLDTLQDLTDSVNDTMRKHHMPLRTMEEVRGFVGNGIGKLVARAVPPGTKADKLAQCLSDFRLLYAKNMRRKTAPYPGIPELLMRLRADGFRLAVVSNKIDEAAKELCRAFFQDMIPVTIGESPDVARKPAPDSVLCALSELDVSPSQAVYVGDSEVDLETAKNAGLPCLSVTWGFRDADFLRQYGAAALADTPSSLLEMLEKNQAESK